MNKKLIAKNFSNKIKNLTVDKEYDLIAELGEGEHVVVENDQGKAVRYSKNIFEEIPEPVIYTLGLLKEHIVISEEGILTINIEGVRFNHGLPRLGEDRADISCGIGEITGLNALKDSLSGITTFFSPLFGNLTEEELEELKVYIFGRMLNQVINFDDRGIYLLSTNINQDHYNIIEESINLLEDRYKITTTTVTNPNSTNPIILFVVTNINEEE